MSSMTETNLLWAAVSTFEQLGFMFPAPELAEDRQDASLEACADLEFEGPFRGRLSLTVYGSVMAPLAANMLGEDVPPSRTQQHDALGEIGNVICGNLLPRIGGTDAVFKIGAPRVTTEAVTSMNSSESCVARVSLAMDEGRADLKLFVSESLPS
jgi:CheY-specific phosphatase CheX